MLEKLLFILCVLIFVLEIVYIYVANDTSLEGIPLGKLQQEVKSLTKENMLLRQQLYEDAAYTYISTKAAGMGFVPAKQSIFLH